jgi:hypothetical protein
MNVLAVIVSQKAKISEPDLKTNFKNFSKNSARSKFKTLKKRKFVKVENLNPKILKTSQKAQLCRAPKTFQAGNQSVIKF